MSVNLDKQIKSLKELLKYVRIPNGEFDAIFSSLDKYQKILALRDIPETNMIDVLSEIITIMESDL